MSDGFLGRWSRRKLDVQQGKAVEAEPEVAPVVVPPPPSPPQPSPGGGGSELQGQVEASAEAPPPPTLEDVQSLTPESDFRRFVAADVSPDVKNAAMKKLFSDPHFNVMDRMDVYIDDYSKPDPIPQSMLRQLASAKFLNLFKDEEEKEAQARAAAAAARGAGEGAEDGTRDVADDPAAQSVAQLEEGTPEVVPPAVPESPHHADPDLQLQQDHAAAGKDPGRGTG